MSRRLQRLVALCLLLVWGPAVLCCAMEAAGWGGFCEDAACHADHAAQVAGDSCNAVESGNYQSVVPVLKLTPALAVLRVCFIPVPEPAVAATPEPWAGGFDRPHDWLVRWQFVRRAAAPAHAPDSLNA